jgi:glycogen synthase
VRVLSVGALYPPHDLGGGYELTWRSSVLHLRARGHDVRVLAGDHRAPGADEAEELDPDVHRDLRWYWRDGGFPPLSLAQTIALERHNRAVLLRHLRRFRPEVVAWWQMSAMSLSMLEQVRRAGLPAAGVVGNEWLAAGERLDRWLSWCRAHPRRAAVAGRLLGLPVRADLDGAATWLLNSEATARQARAAGLRLPDAAVVHPGADHGLFTPAPPPPWRWRLLYLGRLEPRKGVHLAVEALALLPAEATLVLQGAGEAAYLERLRARAAELGVSDRIQWSSVPRDRLREVYADADALLFPVQWEEPWGLVPLEAMAVGRPVVATGTGGSGEYLRHEENCLLLEPRDSPEALAAAVRRLAGDEALRERLTAAGHRTAARFTQAAYDEAIAAALQRAVAGARRGA